MLQSENLIIYSQHLTVTFLFFYRNSDFNIDLMLLFNNNNKNSQFTLDDIYT